MVGKCGINVSTDKILSVDRYFDNWFDETYFR